jgi:hypothetical protein
MSKTSKTAIKAMALALVLSLFVLVPVAFAWQVYPAFGHNSRYGGEADSGNLGGQLEYPMGYRLARASGEHVKWTASEVSWIATNRNSTDQPAMVSMSSSETWMTVAIFGVKTQGRATIGPICRTTTYGGRPLAAVGGTTNFALSSTAQSLQGPSTTTRVFSTTMPTRALRLLAA